ncbi:MAG: hypothetical protein Q8O87_02330 [bacterium]|nr:hypothetical protein [bacterium]
MNMEQMPSAEGEPNEKQRVILEGVEVGSVQDLRDLVEANDDPDFLEYLKEVIKDYENAGS